MSDCKELGVAGSSPNMLRVWRGSRELTKVVPLNGVSRDEGATSGQLKAEHTARQRRGASPWTETEWLGTRVAVLTVLKKQVKTGLKHRRARGRVAAGNDTKMFEEKEEV